MPRPFYFIGGNNEDFEGLHALPDGGEVVPGVQYLGRVGAATIAGVRVGWLSGIYAPKWLETPLLTPTTTATRKQAGYFRLAEVERLRTERELDDRDLADEADHESDLVASEIEEALAHAKALRDKAKDKTELAKAQQMIDRSEVRLGIARMRPLGHGAQLL